MVAAPPSSSTPSRPSRNNTANLHDNLNSSSSSNQQQQHQYPFDIAYGTSATTTTNDDGSGASGFNPAKRQRRMSLPSGPAGAPHAYDGQFVSDHQDITPNEQNSPYGSVTSSSLSGGMRSRSGTQSKSKKSMLSFMSGASSSSSSLLRPLYPLYPLSPLPHRHLSPCVDRLSRAPTPLRPTTPDFRPSSMMLITSLLSSRLPYAHQAS